MTNDSVPEPQKHNLRDSIILALLALAIVATHAWWLHADTRPQPSVDSNSYLERMLLFMDGELTEDATLIDGILKLSRNGRPPLYTLSAIPFVVALGRSADSAMMLNAAILIAILFATYAIGRISLNGNAGLLAAFVVATMPPIVGLSRVFLPHIATVAIVAIAVACMQHMLKVRTVKSAWLFGLSLGIAALIHPKALFFLLTPATAAVIYSVFFQHSPRTPRSLGATVPWFVAKLRDRFVLAGLLPTAAIAILVAGVWYLPNLSRILSLSRRATEDFHNVTFGFDNTARSFWWFIQTSPYAISWPYVLLIVLALLLLAFSRRELIYSLLVTFVLMYITHSSTLGALAWLNGAAVLPIAAAMIGAAAFLIPSLPIITRISKPLGRWLAGGFIALVVFTGLFTFAYSTVPFNKGMQLLAEVSGSPVNESACSERHFFAYCPNPPQPAVLDISAVLSAIATDDRCQSGECTLAIQGRPIDASPYRYYVVKDGYYDTIRILRETDSTSRVLGDKYEWLWSDFVLYDPERRGTMRGILTRADSEMTGVYEMVAEYPMAEDDAMLLDRRTRDVTLADSAHIKLLNLLWADANNPEEYDYSLNRAAWTFLQLVHYDLDAALGLLAMYGPFEPEGGAELLRTVILEGATYKAPKDAHIRSALAEIYAQQGRLKDALKQLELAASSNPDDATPLVTLGAIHMQSGQPEETIAAWREALALQSDLPETCLQLAQLLALSDIQSALEQYNTCSQLDAGSEYAKTVNDKLIALYLVSGEQAYDDEAYGVAVERLTAAAELQPEDVSVQTLLAKTYRKLEQIPEAILHAEAAAEIATNQASPLVLLGNLYLANEQTEEAIGAWQSALDIQPNQPDICFRLARALEDSYADRALEQYELCTSLDPKNEYTQKARRRYDALLEELAE